MIIRQSPPRDLRTLVIHLSQPPAIGSQVEKSGTILHNAHQPSLPIAQIRRQFRNLHGVYKHWLLPALVELESPCIGNRVTADLGPFFLATVPSSTCELDLVRPQQLCGHVTVGGLHNDFSGVWTERVDGF
jgi:hypothetical protein